MISVPSTDELTIGTFLSPSAHAFVMKDMYVSLPPAFSYSAFWLFRISSTLVKSISNAECTCGDVRLLITMCSAIFRRITVIGVRSYLSGARPAVADGFGANSGAWLAEAPEASGAEAAA